MRPFAAAVAAILLVGGCVADQDTKHYRIPSSSMEPTLHCGRPALGCEGRVSDQVAVKPYGDDGPERGDIVAFRTPQRARTACGVGGIFIKRVIGMPGERWAERDGYVYVNGRKLDEPYIPRARRDSETWPARTIPAGTYFLLGDNRSQSCDSRRWGAVERRSVIGKVTDIKRGSKRIHIR